MDIDPREFARQYDQLSDEALLEIDRGDLTDIARSYYDAEVARRGLTPDPAAQPADGAGEGEELVEVATYINFEEANLAKTLLRSADIPAFLDNEISNTWTGAGGLRLMVPRSFAEQAEEVLNAAPISDEELAAQAEAAAAAETDDPPEEDDA